MAKPLGTGKLARTSSPVFAPLATCLGTVLGLTASTERRRHPNGPPCGSHSRFLRFCHDGRSYTLRLRHSSLARWILALLHLDRRTPYHAAVDRTCRRSSPACAPAITGGIRQPSLG